MKRLAFYLALWLIAAASRGQVILEEDFENGSPPAGWTTTQNPSSVGWEFGWDLGSTYFPIPSHTLYAASNDDAHDDGTTTANRADLDYLISPPMDLTPWASAGVVLTFSYVQPATFGSVGTVEVSLSGGPFFEVLTVDPAAQWETASVDLSAFTVSSFVQIAFHHDDNGLWADGFAVDDVQVLSVPVRDAALVEVLPAGYVARGVQDLQGVVVNRGVERIHTLEVAYQIDGGILENGSIAGLDLGYGESATWSHPIPADLSELRLYAVDMVVQSVDGSPDDDPSNDLASTEITTLSEVPPRRAVLTQHTGAWCGYCPDGSVRLREALDALPGLIGVSVHEADAMEFPEGHELTSTLVSGFPTGLVDLHRFEAEASIELLRDSWLARSAERLQENAPVAVEVDALLYDPSTRQGQARVGASFLGPVQGELRPNLWIVEDGVTGSGPGYDQVNNYDGEPGHPYFGAGNPIVGFVHDRTLRAMVGGTWGSPGILPTTFSDGDYHGVWYSFTLPPELDASRIGLIGVLSRYDEADPEKREILNSDERGLFEIFADGFEWGDARKWSTSTP